MGYDERYRQTKDVFGSAPERILVDHWALIRRDLPVLDVGAGQGRHAFFLAKNGIPVDAIDPSIVGIDAIRAAADAQQLPIRTHVCGFDTFPPEVEAYSAILLFGIVQVVPRDSLVSLTEFVDRWLCPGGLLFVTAFTTEDGKYAVHAHEWREIGQHSFSCPDGEVRTYLEPGELPTLFSRYEVIHYWEGTGPEHHHGDGVLERHALAEAVLRREG